MSAITEQFIVDSAGNRNGVLLDIKRYSELVDAEEELQCIRDYDIAKASKDEVIPFELAIREIEQGNQ